VLRGVQPPPPFRSLTPLARPQIGTPTQTPKLSPRMPNRVVESGLRVYRGTSLMRERSPLGPYSMHMPRALWWSYGGGCLLMSEVLL